MLNKKCHDKEEQVMSNKDGKLTRSEAGKKGGKATADSHGDDFYEKNGEKGGEATAKSHDKDHYEKIGEKGGEQRNK